MELSDKIQRLNEALLGKSETLKFVQLFVDGKPYLRFGEDLSITHRMILGGFIEECKKNGESILPEEDYQRVIEESNTAGEVPFFPVRCGAYQAVGMGIALIDSEARAIIFSGKSTDYRLTPDREHLNQIAEYLPNWTELIE